MYDIGENGDCSVDALISDNVRDLVDLFGGLPNAKASFATKFVNRDLLDYEPRGGSPVIVRDGWLEDWATLFDDLDATLSTAAKRQLACEIIFLTHNAGLHEVNLGWHPRAEEVLWRPELQERKRSQSGQWNVRYRSGPKRAYVEQLTGLLATRLPDCRVRYAF